jgi:formamidopyrimidine-DNA glycosylase
MKFNTQVCKQDFLKTLAKQGAIAHQTLCLNNELSLYFNDTRCFGTLSLYFSESEIKEHLNTIGKPWLSGCPGKLSIKITKEEFTSNIPPNKNICKFLMDQKIFSGIGNYLLSEILYDAKISPWVNTNECNTNQMWKSICKIITNSYKLDGVSLRDYHGVDGEPGEYQNCLCVYNRKFDNFGNHIRKEKGPHGRNIYWVVV